MEPVVITLQEDSQPAKVEYHGTGLMEVAAGQRIRIRRTGGGPQETLLDAEAPAGKVWRLSVAVTVVETDA